MIVRLGYVAIAMGLPKVTSSSNVGSLLDC